MSTLFPRRSSGVLLHPTSLPGRHGSGTLGWEARRFVDFLEASGQSLWQVLPLGPTGFGHSPYSALSAFAGNPLLISPELLLEEGLLEKDDLPPESPSSPQKADFERAEGESERFLRKAYERFLRLACDSTEFHRFCEAQRDWLEAYALYRALKGRFGEQSWLDWPAEYARPEAEALARFRREQAKEIDFHRFVQYLFFRQWRQIRQYANRRGIRIIGDLPIYVAMDSADTWGQRDIFQLDERFRPREVGGVPPDYFNENGQLWGNPVYDWERIEQTGYAWWIRRLRHALSLVDIVRIDHFRGFASYYAIPYGEETAKKGRWRKGPGADLFTALEAALGDLPIIVEDLGLITDEVIELREQFGFPGIKLLQFAFDSGDEHGNDFIPYRYRQHCVVYTGTHDNDTTLGWFQSASPEDRKKALEYMNVDGSDIVWDFIRLGLASVADAFIVPMQDVLGLGTEHRMNYPGSPEGNWLWRFQWDQLPESTVSKLAYLTKLYGR
ncbi:4-alpha-glucanotransferase [Heliomicrobium modesticaldum Ice1]|uniref:4-alpha-glucanotransferase n=1 Tax=Heliobacterium modesticaldum (strain ATCC 51547 / Ice1) TaxID=498761 RepID=B0TGL1_HELMI|nr:4-alpha-glucanotransferase [Heliomicrobium modesticaldum]ABZ83272.1 4-alpha-glucanotransferase [Heliomicrobium modesticaldum Ice1]